MFGKTRFWLSVAICGALLFGEQFQLSLGYKATATDGSERLAARMMVTVSADNETEATARAEKSNPGWKAISAKKISKDPKSRFWQVSMEK